MKRTPEARIEKPNEGYFYPSPAVSFTLPSTYLPPTIPASTYLPPKAAPPTTTTTARPTKVPVKSVEREEYRYPRPAVPFSFPSTYLPPVTFMTQKSVPTVPYLPPVMTTTQKPLVVTYLPPVSPRVTYNYPKPAIKFTLPPATSTTEKSVPIATYLPPVTTTTHRPVPIVTYLPPVSRVTYNYPKPAVPFTLPSTYLSPVTTTTTKRPTVTAPSVKSPVVTYLPPITTTTTPPTPVPIYLPPVYVKPIGSGYFYHEPAIPFEY